MRRLKEKLRETEEALSHARKSAHRAGVDNREVQFSTSCTNVYCGVFGLLARCKQRM